MSKPMTKILMIGGALLGLTLAGGVAATASGGGESHYEMEHVHWHFNGPFGTYDRAAMQRGYQVYREVCSSCHALEHLAFRHLGDKGGPYYDEKWPNPNDNPFVKAFAADWMVETIDPDTGDVMERSGIPADKFPSIFPNTAAAAASNGGAVPPDLSVIVKARGGGADYIYNLLTAYDAEKPHDFEIPPGTHYNPVFEGGAIKMAAPLSDEQVEYADGTPATVEQMAKDVTEFLAWSADPKMEVRKQTGHATMIYLLILSILLWFAYKMVWRNVKH